MKVLSLFDGISCARVALDRAGIHVELYDAFEVDKYAIQVSQKNYKSIRHFGDVNNAFRQKCHENYDLLIGGSPCQDLSIAKAGRKGLDGARSGLFWEYVRILKEVKPKWFILENVASMPKEAKQVITEIMGVEPIMIDATLVSAQRRKRLFWTNIPNITQPKDRGIMLKDILEDIPTPPEGLEIKNKSKTLRLGGAGSKVGDKHEWDSVYQYRRTYWRETKGGKVPTLTANMGTGGNNVPYVAGRIVGRKINDRGVRDDYSSTIKAKQRFEVNENHNKTNTISTVTKDNMIGTPKGIRKLTPIECERLQSLPDNYTEGVSNTQRYKCLGNAFNVEVVAHILSGIK